MGKAAFALLSGMLACATTVAPVQAQLPAGHTDVLWVNTGPIGSSQIDARVHYPAANAGVDVAPASRPGGWPTLVFCHGFATFGTTYDLLGQRMAENGYVTVMLNTGFIDPVVLTDDAIAVYDEIFEANAEVGSLLEGAFDTTRIGVFGHSMGGSVACYAVYNQPGNPLDNPGYACAFSISPLDPGIAAQTVTVPYGILSGAGDTVTPSGPNADVLYANLSLAAGCKFHYHMGPLCDHLNIAGLTSPAGGVPQPVEVFDRTVEVLVAFFDEFLAGVDTGLDGALGPDAVADPNLLSLDQEWYDVRTWLDRPLQVGQTTTFQVGTYNGVCGLVAGNDLSPVPTPTPFGDLLVDPLSAFVLDAWITITNRYDLALALPNIPALAGVTLAVQGFGTTVDAPLTLSVSVDALGMTIAP